MPDIESALSQLVAREYRFGHPTQCRMINGGFGVNDTYEIGIGSDRFILRVQSWPSTKSWIDNDDELRFELDLLDHLNASGVAVAPAIRRINGNTLGFRDYDGHQFAYSLFVWAPGAVVPDVALTRTQARDVGAAMAKLHIAADAFRTTHPRYCLDAVALLDKPLAKLAPAMADLSGPDRQFISEQLSNIRGQLRSFAPRKETWGILHGDIHSQNLHVTVGGAVTLFDFDLCAYGWRAYDVAYYYTRLPASVRQSALNGYLAVRPLSDRECELLPTFGRAAWVWEGLSAPELITRLQDPFI